MAFCIPKAEAAKFLAALKGGKVNPDKLMDMTSGERREFFTKHIGEDAAHEINAMFESKMMLKDQKRGLVAWAKKVSGISEATRRDFLSKIERLDHILDPGEEKEFLEDLAAQKLGMTVTRGEAAEIAHGAKRVQELRDKWDPQTESWPSEDARLKYGSAFVGYQEYVGTLMSNARKMSFKQFVKTPSSWFSTFAGATKGIVASLDNSFFGRQGIKMLYTNPDIWGRAFAKSWGDISKGLRNIDAMQAIKADVFSRPNAMNGKYANGKFALGIKFEEALPSQLPEKIPIFGRLYKASEYAYNGAALRMRADYADRIIKRAEDFGVDMSVPGGQAEGIGALVNAMTGRGNMTLGPKQGDFINAAFFSIRFLKSNFDTLTMHRVGYGIEEGPARQFVRRESAKNLTKIIGATAAIMFTADQLWPGSVEFDPRSSDFGKIKIGNTRFDITGGMGSIITLASRLVPTLHNGKLRFWSKSSTSGRWTDLSEGRFGQRTALDTIESFWEGKLSPAAGVVRDVWRGETFGGAPVTPITEGQNLIQPLGAQTYFEAAQDPNHANLLAVAILDGLGFSTNTYSTQSGRRQKAQGIRDKRHLNRTIDETVKSLGLD